MPDIVTFDPQNRLIVEISVGDPAVNEINATEVYSEWKAWLLADPSRMGWLPAFTPVGGDPRTATQNLGTTYFLENGWRIRPAEYSHKLAVNGNLISREGDSIFRPTVGAYNVHTETVVSNIFDVLVSGSGLSAAQDAKLSAIKVDTTAVLVDTAAIQAEHAQSKAALLINTVIDQCVYDYSLTPPRLLSSRIRSYASAAEAQDPDHNTPIATLTATEHYVDAEWHGETRTTV